MTIATFCVIPAKSFAATRSLLISLDPTPAQAIPAVNHSVRPSLVGVTPPVGMCLFITSEISKAPVIKVFFASIPLVILNCAVLILVTFFPELYLWVPRLFGYDIN